MRRIYKEVGRKVLLFFRKKNVKFLKFVAFSNIFSYTIRNRVARSHLGIGDQAECCAQLFYVKE
jgi:hypothetical protein